MNKSLSHSISFACILLAISICFPSCEKEDDSEKESGGQKTPTSSYSIGTVTATKIALNAINDLFKYDTTDIREREIKSISPMTSDDESKNTVAYICNFKDDAGFAIVAADSRIKNKIIACADNGQFEDNTDNPGLQLMKENIKAYASNLYYECNENGSTIKSSLKSTSNTNDTLGKKQVGPLLKTTWNQLYPYNAFLDTCPVCHEPYYTGCTTTAILQIIAYYNCPGTSLMGEMVAKKKAEDLSDLGKTWVGIYFRAFWRDVPPYEIRCEGTGVEITSAINYLKSYTYVTNRISLTSKKVIENLDNKHPVVVVGENVKNGSGHTWIIDGYYHEQDASSANNTNDTESDPYFHINWGWGGDCDGWYAAGCFDVEKAEKYDTRIIYMERNYARIVVAYELWPKDQEIMLDIEEAEVNSENQ